MVCYYTFFEGDKQRLLSSLIPSFSKEILQSASSYLSIGDQANFLLGRRLIREALGYFNLPYDLTEIKYTEWGKPFFDEYFHFSISHSKDLVLGVFEMESRVGADVQYEAPLNWMEYDKLLNRRDKERIEGSEDQQKAFYNIWTEKESIAKADGRGMTLDFTKIQLANESGFIKEGEKKAKRWQLKSIDLHENYSVSICSLESMKEVKLVQLNIDLTSSDR